MNLGMRLYQRDNGTWYAELERDKRISLKTKDKALAQQLYRRLKKDYLLRKVTVITGQGAPPEKTLSEFAEEYLDHSEKTKARKTYLADDLALRKFIAFAGKDIKLSQISRQHIDRFMAEASLSIKKVSVNTYFRHVKAAFSQAVEWGHIKANPCHKVKPLKYQEEAPRYLTREEVTRLLAAEEDPRYRQLWLFYLLTGCRRREALQITTKDIDYEQGRICIRKTKSDRIRIINITDRIAELLQSNPVNVGRLWPWQPDSVSHHFRDTARKAKIPGAHLHHLRHTFASHLVMSGVDLYAVKELLGHTDMKTTQIYAHLSQDYLKDAMGKLKFGGD